MKKNKTYSARPLDIQRRWFCVDAHNQILGRLATKVAEMLSGKHKPIYTPHLDTGDYVIVVNAAAVKVTGKKEKGKMYFTHSGYPGGDKLASFEKLIKTHPERVIRYAVRGMLPSTKLGEAMLKKLKVYRGTDHPHAAQKPEALKV